MTSYLVGFEIIWSIDEDVLSIGSEWELWNGYILGAALRAANILSSIQNSEQNARQSLSIQNQSLKALNSSQVNSN